MRVTWKAAGGQLKSRFTLTSDANGYLPGNVDVCSTSKIVTGDRITATAGAAKRTFTVPRLSATFDRKGGLVHGMRQPAVTCMPH